MRKEQKRRRTSLSRYAPCLKKCLIKMRLSAKSRLIQGLSVKKYEAKPVT